MARPPGAGSARPWRTRPGCVRSGGGRTPGAGLGAPFVIAEALRAAGLSAGGEPGLTLLEDAVGAAQKAESPLEQARARVALGGALRRAGRRVEAREPLRIGLDIALDRGAAGLAGPAHEELVAAGAQPRRLRITGADALTATERRIAAMAAQGMTNRSVAQALFVSEKTVETHLGHAYRKLGISSRTHLASALGPRADLGGGGSEISRFRTPIG